jgi:U2-associated protein SR140
MRLLELDLDIDFWQSQARPKRFVATTSHAAAMSGPSKVKEFPDISSKLNAPVKKSLFEKQKAEAEAKRKREEAENAAAYKDFVKSFEDASPPPPDAVDRGDNGGFGQAGAMGASGFGGTPRRHFPPAASRGSGPGSLGTGPPTARKRALDGSMVQQRDRLESNFSYDDVSGPVSARTAFQAEHEYEQRHSSGDEDQKKIAKPTLHLSSIAPGMSTEDIKDLFPENIKIDNVRRLPPPPPSDSTERVSQSVIVTLAGNTPGKDIDAAVSALNKRYLGFGYHLAITRHLSSAAIGNTANVLSSNSSSLPFGAKLISTAPANDLSRAPPPSDHHRGGIPPPSSYAGGNNTMQESAPITMVTVVPPTDIRQLQLINMTVEQLLKHGAEFEAILMNQEEIQQDEDWAFLWDARSVSGVYYRYRLWTFLSGALEDEDLRNKAGESAPMVLFEDEAPWLPPTQNPQFEFATRLDELVSDPEYDSELEEESGDEAPKRPPIDAAVVAGLEESAEPRYLNPYQRAKLTHLLARLPTSTSRLRRGDVARVTNFAISYAGRGAEDVVQMLLMNVETPFAFTSANPDYDHDDEYMYETDYFSDESDKERDEEPEDVMESIEKAYDAEGQKGGTQQESGPEKEKAPEKEKEDPSSSKMISLYVISDILHASANAGVRNAWKYRPLFEAGLRDQRIFEHLGRLERELGWGKIKADRWRASVMNLVQLWEGWSVFSDTTYKTFKDMFQRSDEDKEKLEADERDKEERRERLKKWKSTKEKADADAAARSAAPVEPLPAKSKSAKAPLDKRPSDAAAVDEPGELDVYDEEMPDRSTDGRPTSGGDAPTSEAMEQDTSPSKPPPTAAGTTGTPAATASKADVAPKTDALGGRFALAAPTRAAEARQRRPKAVDMFADSDED